MSLSQTFNLYLLEEGEIYIKEYLVDILENNQTKKEGVIYLCSRSFIFESNNKSSSIEKYMFKYSSFSMITSRQSEKESILIKLNRIIQITSANNPYETLNTDVVIEITFKYMNNQETFKQIERIIQSAKSKKGFDSDDFSLLNHFYKFKFDYTHIESIHEKCLLKDELKVNRIIPLIEIPGLFMVTNEKIYYQPIYVLKSKQFKAIPFNFITNLYRRRIKLMEVGLEIIYNTEKIKGKTLLIEFETNKTREFIYDLLLDKASIVIDINELNKIIDMIKKWTNKEISNYDYLLFLNSAANRTRNHLSQYPVFPWVLSDYSSFEIDLNNPNVYRDLSKPIGALNQKRLDSFKERYEDMPEPKYLYGTHYSTPAYTIGYLVRKYPHFMIKLQAGRFDHPDRLFTSMEIDWEVNIENPGSLKELIPEFYEENTDFLENKLNINLNVNQSINGNVDLPRWAKNSSHFLRVMRSALESDYVSSHINHWIDLIFGYKQRGVDSIKANNLFHPLTYEVDLNSISDEQERKAAEIQVAEYGQSPNQLFSLPHPKRNTKNVDYMRSGIIENTYKSRNISKDNENESMTSSFKILNHQVKEEKKEEVIIKEEERYVSFFESLKSDDHLKKNSYKQVNFSVEDRKFKKIQKFHKASITSLTSICNYSNYTQKSSNSLLVAGSSNGFIKVFDSEIEKHKQYINVGNGFSITAIGKVPLGNQILIGSDDFQIQVFNVSLAKSICRFKSHDDSITSIKSISVNEFLSTSLDCSYKLWDLTRKIPISNFYDLNDSVISSDLSMNGLFMCMDTKGNVSIRPSLKYNELKNIRQGQGSQGVQGLDYSFCKFSNTNEYHYFLGSSKSIKAYDIRNFQEFDFFDVKTKAIKGIIDSNDYLLAYTEDNVLCYKYKNGFLSHMQLYKEYENSNVLTCMEMSDDKNIYFGGENGDLSYSFYRKNTSCEEEE